MTRARAPGKVVISGAYAVLSGAPALTSAVSRYVSADTSRPAELVTDEVRTALSAHESAPWFDASALRQDDRKLGLGSSAAILVASLFALGRRAEPERDRAQLRAEIFGARSPRIAKRKAAAAASTSPPAASAAR